MKFAGNVFIVNDKRNYSRNKPTNKELVNKYSEQLKADTTHERPRPT